MHLIRSKKKLKNKRILEISFLSSLILILFLIQIANVGPSLSPNNKIGEHQNLTTFNDNLKIAADNEILFQGTEEPLNITDYGNLYELNQEVSLTNEEELNLTYYLDGVNGWKVSQINLSLDDIHDERDWISDKDFFSIDDPFRKYQSFQNRDSNGDWNGIPLHNYERDLDNDPTDPGNIHSTISEPNAIAMRIHFTRIEIEDDWDALFFYDSNNILHYTYTGNNSDGFLTPWLYADELKLTMDSDAISVEWWGYEIDYYEFYNSSTTNYYNYTNNWGYVNGTSGFNYGPGNISDTSAMYVALVGSSYRPNSDSSIATAYYAGDFSELCQNITVPRGGIIDAYINFDYYAEEAMTSNENFIYLEINNKRIYSRGLRDVTETGRNIWYNTGDIYMDLWVNSSNVFDLPNEKDLNISIGVMSGATVSYSGFEDRFQQIVWFDNLSLVLITLCNATQNDINLKINGNDLIDSNSWGKASLENKSLWEENPVILTVNTSSPSLSFKLNTTLYGFHNTTTKINQQNDEAVSYKILSNGTIYWEFLHNLYMPSQYNDFEFILEKPVNWKFLSVLDPTFQSRPFEGGDIGDNNLKINISNAIYPGWWTFKATSPNYLNITNTKMLKNGQWTQSSFKSGESTKIKTNITYNNDNPPDLNYTFVNLLIYDPQERLWYNNSIAPELNGEVIFSLIQFTSKNTIGGVYTYMLLWSNGTALGGVSSSFIISHESKLELLKPDEAEDDLRLEAFLGDIIPLRVYLYDDENDLPISGAVVYYEWDDGEKEYLEEASPGVYEATIETDDFESTGLYEIEIHASKVGFSSSDITLELDLTEETDLLFWIIIAALIGIISILCVLSLRSYVFIPRKHRKEADLIAKTQRFKDLQNTQAVVIIHKSGGLPVFLKSYSILEHQKKELFSGFIHAITTIGEEIAGKRTIISEEEDLKKEGRVLEIDFKHFHCLIADKGDVRTIFILRDKSSERLRKLVKDFSLYIYSKLKDRFASWDGSLDEFEKEIPPILNEHFELFYKEPCKLTKPEIMAKIRKEDELNSMELRILNVIYSLLKGKGKTEFYLDYILEVVHEENKDLIIESIETLIDRKIIVPSTDRKYK